MRVFAFLLLLWLAPPAARGGEGALVEAAASGEPAAVEFLLAAGADPDEAVGNWRMTPLMGAVMSGKLDIVRALVAAGAEVDRVDGYGDPAINWAAYLGRESIVAFLLAAGANPNVTSRHGAAADIAQRRGFRDIALMLAGREPGGVPSAVSAAARAAWRGDRDGLARALKAGASPASADVTGTPLLVIAAWAGRYEVVEALLAAGAPVDGADFIGFTPLLHAAREGHGVIAKRLLRAGADPSARARPRGMGTTALHLAAAAGEDDIVAALLDAGAAVDATDALGASPLLSAVTERRDACARSLVAAGADPARTDLDGRSPLQLAEHTGQADLASWLASQVAPGGGGDGTEPLWAAL